MTGDASLLTRFSEKHRGFVTYGDKNKARILGGGNLGDKGTLLIKL